MNLPEVDVPKPAGRWADLPEVDVEKMDYEYVTKCESAAELRDIYTVLCSGKEGRYPHLEQFTEKRLLELLPARERKLWIAQRTEPSLDEKMTAAADLADWASSVSKTDKVLSSRAAGRDLASGGVSGGSSSSSSSSSAQAAAAAAVDPDDIFGAVAESKTTTRVTTVSSTQKSSTGRKLPPVRNQKNSANSTPGDSAPRDEADSDDDDAEAAVDPSSEAAIRARNEKRRRYGFEYFKEWDKFDPDAEMKKMEELEQKEAADVARQAAASQRELEDRRRRRAEELRKLGLRDDKEDMSTEHRRYVSEREKQKGNECFRAKEYDEAFLYYSRALYFDDSNHIVHANRAMVCIRLKKYEQAETDCSKSLELDPSYTKALSRRGMARHKQGKYLAAIEDFEAALEAKPTSKELKELLQKSRKMHEEVGGITADGKAAPPAAAAARSGANKFSRIQIVEEDSSDEESSDDEGGQGDASARASGSAIDGDFEAAAVFAGARQGYISKWETRAWGTTATRRHQHRRERRLRRWRQPPPRTCTRARRTRRKNPTRTTTKQRWRASRRRLARSSRERRLQSSRPATCAARLISSAKLPRRSARKTQSGSSV
jgi:tetratricopeptide (TPR) repeat protein